MRARTTRLWPALALMAVVSSVCLACGAAQRGEETSRAAPGQPLPATTRATPPSATGARAAAGLRRLHFDLSASRVWVGDADSVAELSLSDPDLAARWVAFRELLAREHAGPWSAAAREMARTLGHALLGPITSHLQGSTGWEVSPLELAPLGAVIAPWSSAAEPVQASIVVWYSAAAGPPASVVSLPERADDGPSPAQQAAMPRPSGILAVAPFRPGVAPALDDPDTMLWAMRRAARSVELVPRNDTGATAIEGALREHRYAMSWLRATPEQAAGLLAPLDRGPLLLWWTLPGTQPPALEAVRAVAQSWLVGSKGIALDLWPRDPKLAEPGTVAFLTALREGRTACEALQQGAEALRTAGAPASQWAAWIYVGSPLLTAPVQAPGWLQRSP